MKTKTALLPLALALTALGLVSSIIRQAQAAAWITNSPMASARQWHTATLLPSGKVLVAGGVTNYVAPFYSTSATAELYDPANGGWAAAASMSRPRALHTATLLPNGKVLVAGGYDFATDTALASAELYDPATGTWTATGPMTTARSDHRAVLLSNGKVLVTSGTGGINFRCPAESYDPATGEWTPTGTPNFGRYGLTLTLLPNGQVLAAGGFDGVNQRLVAAELYNPADGMWTAINPLNVPRDGHTATVLPNGLVLVAGGIGTNTTTINSVELFDPETGTWTTTNNLNTARGDHTASLLPNGKVLVASGDANGVTAELYDPATGSWTATAALNASRYHSTATMLASGRVLMVGGVSTSGFLASSELYEWASGTWAATGEMGDRRSRHTATLLPNGKVLVAGGSGSTNSNRGQLYKPASGTWTTTGPLVAARYSHTATLLPNGNALVAGGCFTITGGSTSYLSSAETFDPTAGTWTITGALAEARSSHTATLLPNGKVLVAGGYRYTALGGEYLSSAEVFDPASGSWTQTGGMITPRAWHTATLLPNGKVLAAGGANSRDLTSSAELYDPATGKWTATGALNSARFEHTATLLPNGQVLVAAADDLLVTAECYDPTTGRWTMTGSLNRVRWAHTATLLPNGKVLVAGGEGDQFQPLYSAELYDPAIGTWTVISMMTSQRAYQTATLLPDGKVLIAGGSSLGNSAELYDSGLGFSAAWRPQITSLASPLSLGASLALTGSGFRGVSGGSGGHMQDSPADYPLVQLRSLESERTMFLPSTNWQTNLFTSASVWGFPPGYALATVFVNGIPSTGAVVKISVPVPAVTVIADTLRLTNGAFQFAFTNNVGVLFGVLATTNPTLPLSNWTPLGGVTEVSPGQFEFTDPQAGSTTCRFYRLRSP